jgi:hypothetical protein
VSIFTDPLYIATLKEDKSGTMTTETGVTVSPRGDRETINAASIQVARQSTDSFAESTTTKISPPGDATGTSEPHSGGGLSQGAAIGIGVGVSVGVLLLAIVSGLLWRRRRTKLEDAEREKWRHPGGGDDDDDEYAARENAAAGIVRTSSGGIKAAVPKEPIEMPGPTTTALLPHPTTDDPPAELPVDEPPQRLAGGGIRRRSGEYRPPTPVAEMMGDVSEERRF